jgi:uncharacterized protein (TIGR02611 family)
VTGPASEPQTSEAPLSDLEPEPPRWLQPFRSWVVRRRGGLLIWKAGVGVVGGIVVVGGLLLIPLPGPGWAIVFLGLAVWATEFLWAKRLLAYGRQILRRWTAWVKAQSLFVRILIGIAGLAVLAGLAYLGWRIIL